MVTPDHNQKVSRPSYTNLLLCTLNVLNQCLGVFFPKVSRPRSPFQRALFYLAPMMLLTLKGSAICISVPKQMSLPDQPANVRVFNSKSIRHESVLHGFTYINVFYQIFCGLYTYKFCLIIGYKFPTGDKFQLDNSQMFFKIYFDMSDF